MQCQHNAHTRQLPCSKINISDTVKQNESDEVRGTYKQQCNSSQWRKFIRMEDALSYRNKYELRKHKIVLCLCCSTLIKVVEIEKNNQNLQFKSDVWLTVHRNSVWIRKTNQVSLFVFFISLLIVAQHVSGNHVPIIRS